MQSQHYDRAIPGRCLGGHCAQIHHLRENFIKEIMDIGLLSNEISKDFQLAFIVIE